MGNIDETRSAKCWLFLKLDDGNVEVHYTILFTSVCVWNVSFEKLKKETSKYLKNSVI